MMKRVKIVAIVLFIVILNNCQWNVSTHSSVEEWNQTTLDYLEGQCPKYLQLVRSLKSSIIPPTRHDTNDLNDVVHDLLSVRQYYYPKLVKHLQVHGIALDDIEIFEHFTSSQVRIRAKALSGEVFSIKIEQPFEGAHTNFSIENSEAAGGFDLDDDVCIAIPEGVFPDRFVFVSKNTDAEWVVTYAKIY